MHTYNRVGVLEMPGLLSKVTELMGELDNIQSTLSNDSEAFKFSYRLLKARTEYEGHMLKLLSVRLMTFAKHGICCAGCGLVGRYFAVEKHPASVSYHANLYAVNAHGKEVLMTHDHILARALGGADNLSNTQTMCSPCNAEKSILEGELFRERQSNS